MILPEVNPCFVTYSLLDLNKLFNQSKPQFLNAYISKILKELNESRCVKCLRYYQSFLSPL